MYGKLNMERRFLKMRCEICNDEIRIIAVLPKRINIKKFSVLNENRTEKSINYLLNYNEQETMICISCMRQSKFFCQKHNQIHMGYPECTLCVKCVIEDVYHNESYYHEAVSQIFRRLPIEQLERLVDWSDWMLASDQINRDLFLSVELCIMSVRKNMKLKEIVNNMINNSIDDIVPYWY